MNLLEFPITLLHLLHLDGDDYTTKGFGTFVFQPTSRINDTVCRSIAIKNDIKYEMNETFIINLTTVSQEFIAFLPQKTTITIIDDDSKCIRVDILLARF